MNDAVTLAVLAGGEGTRMGLPKDLLQVRGVPLAKGLLERLAWPGPTLLIGPHGSRLPPGHESFDRVAGDARSGEGPLRGIMTALSAATTESVVVIPVDMPRIAREHLVWIADQLADRPAAAGVMCERGGRVEPFPFALRLSAAPLIRARLESGTLGVQALREDPAIGVVQAPQQWSEGIWLNVNTPADLPPGWQRPPG